MTIENLVIGFVDETFDDPYMDNFEEVESNEDICGKCVEYTVIVKDKLAGKFYAAISTKTNSGAWADSEKLGDTEYFEVKQVQIVKYDYVPV